MGRRKVLSTLFSLCAQDAWGTDTGINIEDFAEYLTFVDPDAQVSHFSDSLTLSFRK